ncbi:hypothetical protein GKG47_09405 [Lactonifactor sp. BIOML-A3]|nr:hypothetical protein [Lactonifactor sp. BIOML-A5]MSA08037.1 hypothetical protein [Lactonifactor sp. BIOML-A4]MSA12653.1 hypothetical protein [Lactonifactor sp. BIOML-A3]MSA16645.1 hypothetical protein [Lactonifactor sp. BIOML-A2]MSA37656.1 hypothetical protein [Lactonifactor sp. BIOML-A1]MSB13394.1 hypothetical protein [Lactonifactor sp. BIOML-A6]MSB69459.1 hypothetical protein [Lactonifactor sp. BIOML-A7]
MLIAIDPGSAETAYVILDDHYKIYGFDKVQNEVLLEKLRKETYDEFVIENIASYGMGVGREVFDTCIWIGRFWEVANAKVKDFIYRKDEKINLCGSMKAKDSNIRIALIDRFAKFDFKNGKGNKKNPDVFYGFKADIWAAMAVGVTYLDMKAQHEEN